MVGTPENRAGELVDQRNTRSILSSNVAATSNIKPDTEASLSPASVISGGGSASRFGHHQARRDDAGTHVGHPPNT